jgi:hypothetical protein
MLSAVGGDLPASGSRQARERWRWVNLVLEPWRSERRDRAMPLGVLRVSTGQTSGSGELTRQRTSD